MGSRLAAWTGLQLRRGNECPIDGSRCPSTGTHKSTTSFLRTSHTHSSPFAGPRHVGCGRRGALCRGNRLGAHSQQDDDRGGQGRGGQGPGILPEAPGKYGLSLRRTSWWFWHARRHNSEPQRFKFDLPAIGNRKTARDQSMREGKTETVSIGPAIVLLPSGGILSVANVRQPTTSTASLWLSER